MVGAPFTISARLENRGALPIAGVTLLLNFPDGVQLNDVTPEPGYVAAAGNQLRWSIGTLAPGGAGLLTVDALVGAGPSREIDICATLLSQGAPLEHCIGLFVSALGRGQPTVNADLEALYATPGPAGGVFAERDSADFLRWGLLIAGMVILGVWLGAAVRSRDDGADAPPGA
jgi:hypothetical protein